MGGRGSTSGVTGGGTGAGKTFKGTGGLQHKNGAPYTDNNNQNLLKYQKQSDDKAASFLAGTDKNIDLKDPKFDDGYPYHDIPLNKLLLRLDVTGRPHMLNDENFDKYVKKRGETVIYRGWSGDAAVERFVNATHNHVGNGIYGDGYYFTPSKSTAKSYGAKVTEMALSPTARVISRNQVLKAINNADPKLKKALGYTGRGGAGRTYGTNRGEMQMALKMGYNVIDMGSGYYVAGTADAFVVKKSTI